MYYKRRTYQRLSCLYYRSSHHWSNLRAFSSAEPLRDIFRQHHFPEGWIATHIIDIPEEVFVAGGTTVTAYAQAEISRRMRIEKTEKVIASVRTRPGLFDEGKLDMHGETSSAAIEQLIVIG